MDASKENCQHALDNLEGQERFMNEYAFKTVKAFLEAALKRVPSQAAIDRDKERRKGGKSSGNIRRIEQ